VEKESRRCRGGETHLYVIEKLGCRGGGGKAKGRGLGRGRMINLFANRKKGCKERGGALSSGKRVCFGLTD